MKFAEQPVCTTLNRIFNLGSNEVPSCMFSNSLLPVVVGYMYFIRHYLKLLKYLLCKLVEWKMVLLCFMCLKLNATCCVICIIMNLLQIDWYRMCSIPRNFQYWVHLFCNSFKVSTLREHHPRITNH